MLLPGPEAHQLATYIGWLLHRVRGGLIAGGLFVLPSVFVLLALSWVYAARGDSAAMPSFLFIFLGAPYLELLRTHRALGAALSAVTSAVVGVVLNLALVFGTAVLLPADGWREIDWFAAAIASIAFLALWRLRIGVAWLVLAGGLIGFLREILRGGLLLG